MSPNEIAFDIDGVVSDTMAAFLRIAREEYGIGGLSKEQITSYWLDQCLPIPPHVVEAIVARIIDDPLGVDMELLPGAKEVLRELARHGPLRFVTARPRGEPVARWLSLSLELPPERIQVVATGAHGAKAPLLTRMGVGLFVEDHLETCMAIQRAGITAVVFDQPWNRAPSPCPRVSGWEELAGLLGGPQKSIPSRQK